MVLDSAFAKRLDAVIDASLAERRIVGGQILVARDGEILECERVLGRANRLDHGRQLGQGRAPWREGRQECEEVLGVLAHADGLTPRIGAAVQGIIEQPGDDRYWPLVRWHLDPDSDLETR